MPAHSITLASNRRAIAVLALGSLLALAAQITFPGAVALYDGVVPTETYKYLDPGSGQAGSPGDYNGSPGLDNGTSKAFAAATTERPPQAQLIAGNGAFIPPAGATSMNVSIAAVEPDTQPAQGAIAGNVYDVEVVDDDGNAFTVASTGQPTITLRAPDGVTDGVIGHLGTDGWVAIQTTPAGALHLFQAEIHEIGQYAVLTGVAAPSDLTRFLIILGTIGLPSLAVIVYLFRRARRDRRAQALALEAARNRARIPSKRRRRR
jgi:hypothetical protein